MYLLVYGVAVDVIANSSNCCCKLKDCANDRIRNVSVDLVCGTMLPTIDKKELFFVGRVFIA